MTLEHPILVVDDDPAILRTVVEILEFEGYVVTTANNGAEALERIRHLSPILILLDMRMPVLDGWGFAQRLHDLGLSFPLVVMTAAQDPRGWAQEIGANFYLPKPFSLTELLKVVEHAQQV